MLTVILIVTGVAMVAGAVAAIAAVTDPSAREERSGWSL